MPRSLKKILFVMAVLLVLLIPFRTAAANAAQQPDAEFKFKFETGQPLEIIEAHFYSCGTLECSTPFEWEETPEDFYCTVEDCYSWSYGYGDYFKLVITFSDGVTRQSNIFEKKDLESEYTITVFEDRLFVEETSVSLFDRLSPIDVFLIIVGIIILIFFFGLVYGVVILCTRGDFQTHLTDRAHIRIRRLWISGVGILGVMSFVKLLGVSEALPYTLIPTILVEGLILFVIYKLFMTNQRIPLVMSFSENILTQLLLWVLVIISGGSGLGWRLLIAIELGIVLIEAVILYLPQRRQVSFRQMLALSFVLNLASFTVGLFLPI